MSGSELVSYGRIEPGAHLPFTVGRTGKMHAWQWEEGAQPDLQIVGKGLGGGYAPISAILIGKSVVDAFQNGSGAFNNGGSSGSAEIS